MEKQLPNGGRDLLNDPRLTGVVCLTEWHKRKFTEQFPEARNKIHVIGNGVDVSRFKNSTPKVSNSFVYTSHSERGLGKILSEWLEIKSNVCRC